MVSESFEHVLKAAQLAGSLTPAWKKFIKTKFFVAILRSPDDDPKNFLLSVSRHPVDGKPVVIINRGWTRGDDFATLKIEAGVSEALTYLAQHLPDLSR